VTPIVLPPPVRPGDRVGVAALSGPVDPGRLARGVAALAALGYEPVPAPNLGARHDLFAGDDAERLAGFHQLAADPSVAAIVFARGGHGLLRLLPAIDWALLALRPRAYVGYSDLTPLLVEIPRRLGFASFHGPMAAADLARGLAEAERLGFVAGLAGEWPQALAGRELAGDASGAPVEGPLLGGCLSLLCGTLGTAWAPRFDGAILLLEETGEPSYRIDRMLTHLALSGSLAAVRAVVTGELEGVDAHERALLPALARVVRAAPGRPVLGGLPIGHAGPNRMVPLGPPARLDPRSRTLTVGLAAARR
jgi:muramoyltetrapeptide carboxypeptidase